MVSNQPTALPPERNSAARASQPHAADGEVRSEALFTGRREVTILHAGERYRLRLTRANKLILTK